MNGYDAAFQSAIGGEKESPVNPYDAIMAGLVPKAASAQTEVPAVVSAGQAINSIPRQLGLTARYGLEGIANTAQIVTEPLRYLTDRLTGQTGKTLPLGAMASKFSDAIGLPSPQNPTERVIGDATRLLAGSGGMGAAASTARTLPNMAGQAATFLSSNMPQQLSSAAGAGLAGGASREGGGNEWMQAGAALGGGVVAGLAPGTVGGMVNSGRNLLNKFSPQSPQQIDAKISILMERAGVDYSQIPERVRQILRSDLAGALHTGAEVNPDALRRLADFRATGTTPTRGMISQNPVHITQEMNLAKMSANSSDNALHGLPLIQNQNNSALIRNLNDAGASAGNLEQAGSAAINSIGARDAALKNNVTGLYNAARNMPGGDIPLNRTDIVNGIYGALARENKLAYLPEDIANTLNTISNGQITRGGQTFSVPFDAKALDNLMTDIATAQRSTQDGNVKAALMLARRAIEGTQLTPVKNTFGGNQLVTEQGANYLRSQDAQAGSFMDALKAARSAAAERFGWQESARPIDAALRSGLRESDPAKFMQQYVIGGSLKDAEAVANNAPVGQVKNAILAHLKEKALNGASDEVGKFSQSAFNRALSQIGERKLGLFFSPEEIAALQANGRVASYMQVQPVGSAVNNSNSGALLLGKGYDAIKGLLSATSAAPIIGPMVSSPLFNGLKNAEISILTNRMNNASQGLLVPQQRPPFSSGLLLPGMSMGGLLAGPKPVN